METSEIKEIFNQIRDFHGLYFDLKPLQIDILTKLANKTSVVAVLKTSYGKSLLYAMLPKILDHVSHTINTTAAILNTIHS